jgi:hypothetical protein
MTGHDVSHPGTNNAFQINAGTEVAMRYNDQSVLENYHAYITLKMLSNTKCDGDISVLKV